MASHNTQEEDNQVVEDLHLPTNPTRARRRNDSGTYPDHYRTGSTILSLATVHENQNPDENVQVRTLPNKKVNGIKEFI